MKLQKKIIKFLKQYSKKDHPDLSEKQHIILLKNHFYFIDDDLGGYYIKKKLLNLSPVDKIIHSYLKENKEA